MISLFTLLVLLVAALSTAAPLADDPQTPKTFTGVRSIFLKDLDALADLLPAQYGNRIEVPHPYYPGYRVQNVAVSPQVDAALNRIPECAQTPTKPKRIWLTYPLMNWGRWPGH
jgi:hypothetical protein